MRRWIVITVLTTALAACSSASDGARPAATSTRATTAATTTGATREVTASTSVSPPIPIATGTAPSTETSTTSPTSTPSTTGATSPTAPTSTTSPDEVRVLGSSVEGRPIVATRRRAAGSVERAGTPIVVIGAIHGDETAGMAVTERLAAAEVTDGIDLWIVPTMNPDGVAAGDRHNAHRVDLNRNFPYQWGPLGQPGDPEYAGPGPASEPETQAIVAFLDEVQPAMVIWYHQDLDRIAPSTGRDGRVRARYAALTRVPLLPITGGTYTGVAATWARHDLPGSVAFIVELGPTLSDEQADIHAAAVLTVAGEL